MSFDKYYPNRKDRRKKYSGAKSVDRSCRCHGGCSYCEGNRMHSTIKQKKKTDYDFLNYKNNGKEDES